MDFFTKKKRPTRIDLTGETSSEKDQPPPKKKYANHVRTNDFSPDNVNERISKLTGGRAAKHAWRRVQTTIEIPYTVVKQRFEFMGKSFERSHFCPWGMHSMIEEKMKAIQVKNSLRSLPNDVKEALNITDQNFDREKIALSVCNTGFHSKESFVRLFCCHCQDSYIPKLLNNKKWGNCRTLEELITSWDNLKIPKALCGIVGCLIYTKDSNVHAGPNAKSYIKEPTEHIKSFHSELNNKELSSKQLKLKADIQLLLSPPAAETSSAKPPPMVAVKPSTTDSSSASLQNFPNQTHLIGKYNERAVYASVDSSMEKSLKTNDSADSAMKKVAKGFCFSIVHSGVNKRLSEAAVIEQYEVAYAGIAEHHAVQQRQLQDKYAGITNNITIEKPQKCCLDDNNIFKYEKSILSAYQTDPNGKYGLVKSSKFWGIMHDGIMKSNNEYNGMYISSVSPETFKLELVPFRLMQMKAGVDAHALIESLLTAFSEFLALKNTAFSKIRQVPGLQNSSIPPTYFKLGELLQTLLTKTEIHIKMSDRLPIANVGDGVGVNVKAARVAAELYGLMTPDFRCFAHSVDGCWKRIARSETMCVEAVKVLYNNLKTVVKHFKYSGKSKELLDASMNVLEMAKGVHLMTWCATRMAHFLVACMKFNELLVPVYNTMYSEDLKKEERDALFHVNSIFTLKVVSDIHGVMHNKLLRSADKTECLVSTAYSSVQNTAKQVQNMKLKNAESFLNSLSIDRNGNLMFEETLCGNKHSLRLADSHHPKRGQSDDDQLKKIKESLCDIQTEVLKNIHDNLKDQIGNNTYFYNWSGMDMADKSIDIDSRLSRLEPLFKLFTNNRVHVVQKYSSSKEKGENTIPFIWHGRTIHLHYSAPIPCSFVELVEEFKNAWAFLSRKWMTHQDKKNQREFFENVLTGADAGVMFPHFCQFLLILLSTPANTSPLERSFSGLQMICTPRRNRLEGEKLECLYLLSTLQLKVKSSLDYQKETEILRTMK